MDGQPPAAAFDVEILPEQRTSVPEAEWAGIRCEAGIRLYEMLNSGTAPDVLPEGLLRDYLQWKEALHVYLRGFAISGDRALSCL